MISGGNVIGRPSFRAVSQAKKSLISGGIIGRPPILAVLQSLKKKMNIIRCRHVETIIL
jgi:NAD(P)H-flavin reductase